MRPRTPLAILAAALLFAGTATAWPQFQSDPARSGSDGLYGAGTGDELWRTDMDGFAGHGGSAVADGVLYRADAGGEVWAVDAATGEVRWRADVGAGFGAPAVAGPVVVGAEGPSLVALDASDGSVDWRVEVPPADDGVARASPAVVADLVAWATPHGQVVVAGMDGALRWNATIGTEIRSSPAVAHGTLFVASDVEDLWAFRVATGDVLWRYPLGSGSDIAPAVADGVVYQAVDFGLDEGVHAVDADDGSRLWHVEAGACGGTAVQAGRVFTLCEDHLVALDAEDGHEIWRADLHATTDPVAFGTDAMPVALGPVVVAGEPDRFGLDRSNITAFDAVDGSEVWRHPLASASSGFPAAADGRLFVATNSFPLIALQLGGPATLPLPPEPLWQVEALVVDPAEPKPGEEVTVRVRIANAGPEAGEAVAVLRLDGAETARRDVARGAGEALDETWRLTVPAGTHSVAVAIAGAGTDAASAQVQVVAGKPGAATPWPTVLALAALATAARLRR